MNAASDWYRPPRQEHGAWSKPRRWWIAPLCWWFGHEPHSYLVRGEGGEPAGDQCGRCGAKRSKTGGFCYCVGECRCAEYDARVRSGWSEWMVRPWL